MLMVPQAYDWLNKSKEHKQHLIKQLIDGKNQVDYINLVLVDSLGVVASLGKHFDYAIFGRDSIRVAKDLLPTHRKLAHDIILTLASLQGKHSNDQNEEEPGKIHHEHRSLFIDGQKIPDQSAAIMYDLQRIWGGQGTDHMTYYGSCDTTPLYIRLVYNYVNMYGTDLLDVSIIDKDGQEKSIRQSVKDAVMWIVAKLEASDWGLLEYKRQNPNGLANQAWKDSRTGYMHADGKVANFDGGIASIEIQGYAYDALLYSVKLLNESSETIAYWQELAKSVQQTMLDNMWMQDSLFFAQGLDRDESGTTRQINTLTSNPGLLLRSHILSDLPTEQRTYYIENIVKILCGPEFMTVGGIRCRALKHQAILDYPDYHGSFTTWPKESYEFAKGLMYVGYDDNAKDLYLKILDSITKSGEFYEFFYINNDSTIWYEGDVALAHFSQHTGQPFLPVPEVAQAWTISAVMAILRQRNS